MFKCSRCGCKESTATCRAQLDMQEDAASLLCSECDPKVGVWHRRFAKLPFDGPHVLNKHGPLPEKYRHK